MNIRSEWRRRTTTASDILGELDMLELYWIEDAELEQDFEFATTGDRVLQLVGS